MTSVIEFSEHPEYLELEPGWLEAKELTEGNRSLLLSPKYLPVHELENPAREGGRELRLVRESHTQYTNFISSFLEIWRGLYFRKQGVLNEDAVKLLEDVDMDVDGEGNDPFQFLKNKLFDMDYMYGRPIVLVDGTPGRPITVQQQKDMGSRAFMSILKPLDVKDWQFNATTSGLEAIRYEFSAVRARTSLTTKPNVALYSRVIEQGEGGLISQYFQQKQNKNGSISKGGKWEPVGEATALSLEEMPVVWRAFQESQVLNYTPEVKRHFMLESSLDNGLAYQAWQRLVVEGMDYANAETVKALTAYTIAIVPDGASMKAIDPANPQALTERIASTRDLIFKKAMKMIRSLPSDSRAAQSAETSAEEKDTTIAAIQSRLDDYEDIMNDALLHYAKIQGQDNLNPKIMLNKDISNNDIARAQEMFLVLRDEIEKMPGVKKELLKGILSDQPFIEEETLTEEIENVIGQVVEAEESNTDRSSVLRDIVGG